MNEVLKSIGETINPRGGNGVVESIVILIIVIAVVYMSIQGIEINSTMGSAFGLIAGFLFGKNTKKGEDDESSE